MKRKDGAPQDSLAPGLGALAAVTIYLIAVLAAERQPVIIGLLAAGVAATFAATRFGILRACRGHGSY